MANMTKRAGKRLADRLGPDETVEHALLVEVKGALGVRSVGFVVARSTTERALERSASDRIADQVGTAERFPAEASVIAATNERVLVVPSNGLTFGPTALEVPRGGLLVGESSGTIFGRRTQLVFADGSTVEVDVMRGQDLAGFTELVGRADI